MNSGLIIAQFVLSISKLFLNLFPELQQGSAQMHCPDIPACFTFSPVRKSQEDRWPFPESFLSDPEASGKTSSVPDSPR